MLIHSSFEDFLLFLYVHISRADSSYDPKELGVIQEKMKGLYDTGVDFEKKLYQTLRQYNNFDKVNLPSLFEETLKHFKSEKSKEKILSDLSDIISADGEVLPTETSALDAFRRTIDLYL